MKTGLILSILFLTHSPFANAQSASAFTAVSSMSTARSYHTATLLQDGRVLIAGGADASLTTVSSAEIYDPLKRTFTPAGNMTAARASHTATLLPDGRVLSVGGEQTSPGPNLVMPGRSAELYDPSTGSFTSTGSLLMGRQGFNATLLANGKVLITGGAAGYTDSGYVIGDAEIYDPATGGFTAAGLYAGTLASANTGIFGGFGSVSTLLADGTTLFAAEPAAQLYDPATDTFSLRVQSALRGQCPAAALSLRTISWSRLRACC